MGVKSAEFKADTTFVDLVLKMLQQTSTKLKSVKKILRL
jgi:hypothetical protein